MDRRQFITGLSGAAAASGAAWSTMPKASEPTDVPSQPLPTIALGEHGLARLIVGSNPLSGYSYLGPHVDRHMKEYFTVERSVEFLLACQRAGINAHQFSYSAAGKSAEIIDQARQRGCRMKFFCLARNPDEIEPVVKATDPIALVHHGGVTDRRFAEGKSELVHDFVKAVHDRGLLAGVSAHNPDCIRRVADAGWEVDFFMTCFYFLTRKMFSPTDAPKSEPGTLYFSYPFYRDDPQVMAQVVRQLDQPCLAFKILAAGRKCASQTTVRDSFRYAFENIKPSDGVIVGMFPWSFDEIGANAGYTREHGDPAGLAALHAADG